MIMNAYRWFSTSMVLLAISMDWGCTTVPDSKPLVEPACNVPLDQSAAVQSLQKQVRERDRRIADLTFQVNALKRIDRDDMEARRSSNQLPRALPAEHKE